MTTRQIIECDRCKREIKSVERKVQFERSASGARGADPRPVLASKDLCETCSDALDAFLGGRELDEPP